MASENVLRKIRALLAKEGATGTTPEEVAAAVALATRLMEREGITQAALEESDPRLTVDEAIRIMNEPISGEMNKSLISWKARLARTLERAFGCFTYTRGGEIKIVGRPSDCETMRYLFVYCAREIERITKENCRGEGKTYANNFKIGCCDAIHTSIDREKNAEREQQRAAAPTQNALVLVNNAIARVDHKREDACKFAYSQLNFGRARRSDNSRYDHGARAAGRHAGAGIYPGSRKGIGAGTRGLIRG